VLESRTALCVTERMSNVVLTNGNGLPESLSQASY
jgi:hypothetical protein